MAELMELTLFQSYYNQQSVNRWNYVASGTPASVTLSFALASAMGWLSETTGLPTDTVGGRLQLLQSASVLYASVLARAVYIDDDFYDSPFIAGTAGATEGGAGDMTPMNAYGFKTNRVKQSIGRGYKRFVGMVEGAVASGGILTGGFPGLASDLADAMSESITYDDEGNTITFVPAVVQKEKYTVESSGKFAYRYYATQATQLTHTAQGVAWTAYQDTRSQVSRQFGRGI